MKKYLASRMAEPFLDSIILDYLTKIPKTAFILDIACGQGYISEKLAKEGYKHLYCADINGENFKLNRKHFHFQKVNANQHLPYNNRYFDVVISSETIEHLDNPKLFLQEIFRILKPKGILILTTPNVSSIISRLYFLFTGVLVFHTNRDYRLSGHRAILPDWFIQRMIKEVGFRGKDKTYNCCYLPIIKLRLTQKYLINPFWVWVTLYKFNKP